MEKKIFVSEESKNHLRRVFACTRVMVWKALNFKSDSELAQRIRFVALSQLHGVPSWKVDEVETTHEETEGTMTQRWGSRVWLVFERSTGLTTLYVDGEVKREERVEEIPAFMEIQREAGQLAAAL